MSAQHPPQPPSRHARPPGLSHAPDAKDDDLDGLDGARRRAQLRADAELLRRAAAALRHAATQGTYRGGTHPEHAYSLASALDLAGLRWRDQDPAMRAELRRCSHTLLDDTDPPADPSADHT